MAHIFRPITVKPIPPNAVKCLKNKKPAVKWKNRQGEWTVAELSAGAPGKCRVESPFWWIEYWDSHGLRQREKVSASLPATQRRLGEIVTDLQREADGLAPLSKVVTSGTLHSLAEEYRDFLRAQGRSEQHWSDTFRQIITVAKDCQWVRVQDVTVAAWSRWVTKQTDGDDGMAAETVNHYLRSLRGFFRWLIRTRRLGADPLAAAKLLNAHADRRVKRRTLAPEEFAKLVKATKAAKPRFFLDGPSRAVLYLMAARTGLRAGTLAQLRPEDLRLDDPIPHVVTEARTQKNRREHSVPLADDLVAELRAWLPTRPAGELLWPGKWHSQNRGSTIVAKDLAAAGIPYSTAEGVYDFHALRGQCGTDLARANVPLVVTQKFLGHSTPTLTARYYVRVGLADLAAAAQSVGRELGRNTPKDPEKLVRPKPPVKGRKSRPKKEKTTKR